MNPNLMRATGFSAEVELVAFNRCPFCNASIDSASFRNAISLKEFRISGLCQTCQDEMFDID